MTHAAPSRLILDGQALVDNWRALARLSGRAACGAAIKADGYGLGAHEVATRLATAGCRDFFVATWAEALALGGQGLSIGVFHGVRDEDLAIAHAPGCRPVLSTPQQVQRWREAGGGRCDVMVDTGMNRLGLSTEDATGDLLDGLEIDVLMSHLASADEDSALNARQQADFAALAGRTGARRLSLANSAGIALGAGYHFDLTRPGVALYGGVPCDALADHIRPVVRIEAQVLQRRRVLAGEAVGYNEAWTAAAETTVAIVNLGYADGYRRGFSNRGRAWVGTVAVPVIGRVSMDLTALDVSAVPDVTEGDWIAFDDDLRAAAKASDISQYELLTGLGPRFDRLWR